MVTIALPPDVEKRLQGEALRRGLGPEELAAKLITEQLAPVPTPGSLGDLFAQWEREDATDDPEVIAQRSCEVKELKEALNRNRLEMEGPNARMPSA